MYYTYYIILLNNTYYVLPIPGADPVVGVVEVYGYIFTVYAVIELSCRP